MFHVLHDFMFYVKGAGYISAAIVMTLFVVFWYYLNGRETKRR